MKKRILALVVGVLAAFPLVGCGSKISNDVITIKQYKGLEVEKVSAVEVTDEDVEASIESTLYTLSTTNEITDRPVQDGDYVTIDYVGKVDGVEFDGGSDEDYQLEIGSGTFIDGFEEAIIGHSTGEVFDINVTFPETYTEGLAGKDAVFTITLDKIEEIIVPELTEDLLPQLSLTATTIEEYKAEVKEDLEESNAATAESELQEYVWAALIENCVIEEYPEGELEEIIAELESQYSYYASYYGVETSELIESVYGITEEEMAQNLLKQQYAVALIAEEEGLTLTVAEYEEELAAYAAQYGYDDPTEFEELVGHDELENMILQNRVGEWLVENCKQVD